MPIDASTREQYEKQIQAEIDRQMVNRKDPRWNWGGIDQNLEQIRGAKAKVDAMLEQGDFGPGQLSLLVDTVLKYGDPMGLQAISENVAAAGQRRQQASQLEDYRNKVATNLFGSPTATPDQAANDPNAFLGQLNTLLQKQQSDIFNREFAPLIRENLISQGIGDSGARVELNARALADLERARQDRMFGAATGAKQDIMNLERSDILGDIGSQQQALANQFDLQRTNITMQFQRQLEQERAQLARELSQRKGGGGMGGMLGMGAGMGAGALIGGIAAGAMTGGLGAPAGAALGASLGGGVGGSIGNYFSPNDNYSALAGVPGAIGQAGSFFGAPPATRNMTPQQYANYRWANRGRP